MYSYISFRHFFCGIYHHFLGYFTPQEKCETVLVLQKLLNVSSQVETSCGTRLEKKEDWSGRFKTGESAEKIA
jgi:hypothetical protein